MYSVYNFKFADFDIEQQGKSILSLIDTSGFNEAIEKAELVLKSLDELKRISHISSEKNKIYIESVLFRIYRNVAYFWRCALQHEFYNAWCHLQDALDSLRQLKRFCSEIPLSAQFFERQLPSIEDVYPYSLFSSIGGFVEHYECSICGKDMDSIECEHIKGELYDGDIAYAIIRNFTEIDHVSIVEKPADKRCVLNPDDNQPGMLPMKHIVEHISDRKLTPLSFREILRIEYEKTNDAFVQLSPNSMCFCGSNRKFKKCCSGKRTLKHAHFEFVVVKTKLV
ncbi:TPA: SEC-C domain-containing protein [Vibrio cholerae]|nr:SEC-C domain-containing protein [Vibrio cholerae]HDI3272206.1 SEC-C domain-containing protein [Vibrio cholerae]